MQSYSYITFLIVIIFFLVPCVAIAQEERNNQPMVFDGAYNGGNCNGCVWVSAIGVIEPDTPRKFQAFLNEYGREGIEVVFHSPGGNLLAALELGRLIREGGWSTRVGRTITETDHEMRRSYSDIEPGQCNSACAYAFMGGRERDIGHPFFGETEGYGIGFHQVKNNMSAMQELSPAHQALFDNTVFSASQVMSGLLVNYMMEMGIDPRMLAKANEAKTDAMYYPDLKTLEAMNVITNGGYEGWSMAPYGRGLVVYSNETYTNSLPVQAAIFCRATSRQKSMMIISDRKTYQRTLDTRDMELINFASQPLDRRSPVPAAELWIDDTEFRIERQNVAIYENDEFTFWDVRISEEMASQLKNAADIALTMDTSRAAGYHALRASLSDKERRMIALAFQNCI